MAVANAVMDVMLEPGFLERVDKIARLLWRELEAVVKKHPKVFVEVRGAGLMLGLRCHVPNTQLVDKLRENGLLAVGAGENVVRLVPPLIIDESHVREAVEKIDRAAAQLSA
jgi:acetylornithine/N-succinyldiaminopimelate aminotransferase